MTGFLLDSNLPARIQFTPTRPVTRAWPRIEFLVQGHKLVNVFRNRIEAVS